MTFQTIGKRDNPAVLLLGGAGLDSAALGEALRPLSGDYCLLLPAAAFCTADALEETLCRDYAGRIWGAYALREGGAVLSELLSRGTVRLRTAVLDGSLLGPVPQGLAAAPTQLIYWMGSRDSGAKKCCKALRSVLPSLQTVTLKKLRAEQLFVALRPDLVVKRLRRSFGRARTVTLSSRMPAGVDRVWRLLSRREPEPFLLRHDEPVADESRRVYITDGQGKLFKLWSHLARLESAGGDATLYTDQVELAAGPLSGAAGLWARLYLKRGQRRCRRELRRGR